MRGRVPACDAGRSAFSARHRLTLLPTFRAAGRFRPLFLRLLFRELQNSGFAADRGLLASELSLSHGDLVALGKGEIWMKAD